MPEFDSAPGEYTPGAAGPLRSERALQSNGTLSNGTRPLTRRELREREKAASASGGFDSLLQGTQVTTDAASTPLTRAERRAAERAAEAAAEVTVFPRAVAPTEPALPAESVDVMSVAVAPVAPAGVDAAAVAPDTVAPDTVAPDTMASPALPSSALPSPALPSPALPSRRALRASREVAPAAAEPTTRPIPVVSAPVVSAPAVPAPAQPVTRAVPPASGAAADAKGAPAASARRPLSRRVATKALSVVAMSFVSLMAVATTVPADALRPGTEAAASAYAPRMHDHSDDGPIQSVEVGSDSTTLAVERDGYDVASVAEYAAASGIRLEATFTNDPKAAIQWPFAVGVHVGDRFGYRNCAGCSSDHGGQDFNPGLGAPIQSIADGVVSAAENGGGSLGVVMMIDHVIDGETVTSVYAHMEYDSMRFAVGDVVSVGDIVGTTGSTGMSTGPHLHFEIRLGGITGTKVDPLEWLQANAGRNELG